MTVYIDGYISAVLSAEKSNTTLENNTELLAENIRLRQQLKETQEHLNNIIELAKQLRKPLMEEKI